MIVDQRRDMTADAVLEDENELSRFGLRKLVKAQRLGLVARWSSHFGYISLHDPTTGEWHDLLTKEAPDWTVREARKRRELRKGGNHRAYDLTATEMEEIWKAARVPEPEGIVEDHPVEEDELGTG